MRCSYKQFFNKQLSSHIPTSNAFRLCYFRLHMTPNYRGKMFAVFGMRLIPRFYRTELTYQVHVIRHRISDIVYCVALSIAVQLFQHICRQCLRVTTVHSLRPMHRDKALYPVWACHAPLQCTNASINPPLNQN